MIRLSPLVKSVYPGAKFGVMIAKGLSAPEDRSIMEGVVETQLERLKSKFPHYERKEALGTEPLCHYAAYYKRHKKSYHVLGQLESVLLKGKSIPPVGAPVEVMFLAEIENMLLTAGHDLDLIDGDLSVDVATEMTDYTGISGKGQQLVKNDIYLSDGKGILSSIINGPDYRTKITAATRNALYFVYGVEGVGEALIYAHLRGMSGYLSQAVQGVKIESIEVY